MSKTKGDEPLVFTMDFNDVNRVGIARMLGKRRGSKASRQECIDWIESFVGDKIMDAYFDSAVSR